MQARTILSSFARGSIVLMAASAASAAWAGPQQDSSGSATDAQQVIEDWPDASKEAARNNARDGGGEELVTSARLEGLIVVTADGEEVGEITQVMDKAGQEIVRIQLDEGFLGIGEQELTVPLDKLSFTSDGQVRTRLNREEIRKMSEPQNRVGGQGDDIQQ